MVVDVSMFAVFSEVFLIDYRIAVVLGFACGVVTNFSLCNWIVFGKQVSPLWRVFVKHCFASLYALFANEIVMISLVEFLNFRNLILAKVISSGIAFIFNFAIKKFYVYNNAYHQKGRQSNQQSQELGRGLNRNLGRKIGQKLRRKTRR